MIVQGQNGAVPRWGTESGKRPTIFKSATLARFDKLAKRVIPTSEYILRALPLHLETEEYIRFRRRQGTLTWRDTVMATLASPGHSWVAVSIAVFLTVTSVASVLISAVQLSYEAYAIENDLSCTRIATEVEGVSKCAFDFAQGSDYFFLVVFGLEALTRIAVYNRPWVDSTVWVDAITIVPLVLRIILTQQGIRALALDDPHRTLCMLAFAIAPLRLLKLTRYSTAAAILKSSIVDSFDALWIPFYLLMVLFTAVGGVVFAFEYDPLDLDNSPPRVKTPIEAWWMLLVTMTTVGYGDYSPQTPVGRLITAIAMCAGLCFTAMPLAIVGNTFSRAWEARSMALLSEQITRDMIERGLTAQDCQRAFQDFDLNGDGSIDYTEFKKVVVEMLGVKLEAKKLREMWRALDSDESNVIRYQEFCQAIFPEYEGAGEAAVSAEAASKKKKKEASTPKPKGTPVSTPAKSGATTSTTAAAAAAGAADPEIERRLAAVEAAVTKQTELEATLQRTLEQQATLQATMAQLLEAMKTNAGPSGDTPLNASSS